MKVSPKIYLLVALLVILVYSVYPINLSYAVSDNEHSTIGGIVVDDLKADDMKAKLQEAVNQWTGEQIVVSGGGTTISLHIGAVQFDIDGTIATYEQMTKKSWFAFWKPKRIVQLPLQLTDNEFLKVEIDKVKAWEAESTFNKVLTQVTNLASHEVKADVKSLNTLNQDRVALEIQPIPDNAAGLSNLVNVLNEQVVNPGQTFSLVETLGVEIELASNESLNFIASMLYSMALKTNSEIYERASQNQIPSYLEPGIEAAITRDGSKDLKFSNTMDYAMQLKLTIEADNLKAEVFGPAKQQEIGVQVTRDYEILPRIIERYSQDLSAGSERLIKEGQKGLRVSVKRYSAEKPEGELISKDYYAPIHREVLKSAKESDTQEQFESELDLNGDGLADYDGNETEIDENTPSSPNNGENLPKGSYYDKGGNLVKP